MKLLIDLLFEIESRWWGRGGGQITYPKKIELKSPPRKTKNESNPYPSHAKEIVEP